MLAVLMTRFDPWVPPGEIVTWTGVRDAVGRLETAGVTATVKVTFPSKPPRLVTRMAAKPDELAVMVREGGDADRVKSGGGGGVIERKITTEWASLPLVPVTFSV